MSNKFNASSLSEYSKSYARKLAGDFFANHSVISGQELLKLSPVKQVNLFAVSSLSEKWMADAERFRSPYFDFEHPEVRQGLQAFMNTVSQHISLRREHLEPLLTEATKKTLILLFDPAYYFDEALRDQPDFSLSADAVRHLTRYTQINRFIPLALEERMKGKDFIYVNQALNWLDDILTQRSRELENPDKYIQLFSEKVLLDPTLLLRKPSYDFHPPQSPPAANKSFFETEIDSVLIPPAPLAAPQPVPNAALFEASVGPSDAEEPVEEPVVDKPVPEPTNSYYSDGGSSGPSTHFIDRSVSAEAPSAPSMQPSQATVRLGSTDVTEMPFTDEPTKSEPEVTAPATVGETFYRAPIESIAKSISLNQKFMFINQLFNGNATSYNQAIEELDRATNYDQARDLISYRYAAQYMWDMSSDEVGMLIEILKRRFA